mmetsp:Transcript_32891/g.86088  ORF Transcript_32891/g.86088 Transcript_32891/m.86088 type:complete len:243 (-) Transcript_32891:21-749(-)
MAPAVVTGVVFVTLLSGGSYHGVSYTQNVVNWVKQLRCHGVPDSSILVLVADSVKPEEHAAMAALRVPLRHVPTVVTPAGDARYHKTSTKIWLWHLTEWKKVVYYDSDMFFLKAPWECAAECPDTADLCAVSDPVGTWPRADPKYINTGFLVIKPSREKFEWLKQNTIKAHHRQFGDQDMLNDLFRDNNVKLPKKCNFLHAPEDFRDIATSKDVVAVHEKMGHMKSMIPANHFLRKCIDIPT